MDITTQINLDNYFPSDIIELHQKGIITLEEILLSGRIYSTFGTELRMYVKSQQKEGEQSTMITGTWNRLQPTRIATINERRKVRR